jgi:hypothetical protein
LALPHGALWTTLLILLRLGRGGCVGGMGGNLNAHELVLLDQASQALSEARNLEEIKMIRDKAEAVRKYAQSASMGLDVQNRAAEVKLRAERQAGKLLSQLMLRGGDRRSKGHGDRLKLDDLGLTSNQSKRWQLEAKIPEELFCDHVRQFCEDGKELTSASLMRLAKTLNGKESDRSHDGSKNGGTVPRHVSNGNGKPARNGTVKQQNHLPTCEFGDLLSELQNHHQVLDGILRPLYSSEASSLRPAEVRMLRYLLTEIGGLLAQLEQVESPSPNCACRSQRVAV